MTNRHNWDLSPTEAVSLQKELVGKLNLHPLEIAPRLIGGADISFNKYSDELYAGIIVLDYASQLPVYASTLVAKATFPYVPGLLSFREIPPLISAWEALPVKPDLMVMDGQGIAHMRGFGVACHFGLLTDTPCLGCAKSVLVGKFEAPAANKGSFSPMIYRGQTVAYALRSKNKVKPVYISPGHLIDLAHSKDVMLHCARGYRIPEPTRQAHLLVNALRRGEIAAGVHTY